MFSFDQKRACGGDWGRAVQTSGQRSCWCPVHSSAPDGGIKSKYCLKVTVLNEDMQTAVVVTEIKKKETQSQSEKNEEERNKDVKEKGDKNKAHK